MYKKLMVTLDGSELSESILPYARLLARRLDLPVDLLRVVEREVIDVAVNPKRSYSHVDAEQDLRAASTHYLEGIAQSFANARKVNCVTFVGDPTEVIIEKAEEQDGTLIAMATHGRSGTQRWYLGSVADKVLHASKSPMLLVKGKENSGPHDQEATINKVLVPLDGSPLAEQALPHATTVARALDAEIDLLRVYSLVSNVAFGEGYMPNFEQITESVREEARVYLKTKAGELTKEEVKHGDGIIKEGDAAAKIIDLAQETPNSLLAMCSHGRSGISRWVLGGTADRVIRYSGDPVLVVRAAE